MRNVEIMDVSQESEAVPFGVGIIGAGHVASAHARHFPRVPGARLVAIADAEVGKAQALAERNGAEAAESAEELLARDDIHAVVVCVPTDQHPGVVGDALAAGKHVLCEKPMALTLADCDQMIQIADAVGRVLTVAQVARQFPEYRQAKRLVESGALGTPALARTRRGGPFPQRPGTDWFAQNDRSGGILLDLLVHDFDFLMWCFGPIVRVQAHSIGDNPQGPRERLDYALVTLRHASGVIGHVEGTWADPTPSGTAFEISGDAGLLAHDARRVVGVVRSVREEGSARLPLMTSPLDPDDDPFYRQALAFVAACRDGAPLAVTPSDAREAVRVALAAKESARTGRAVEL